MPPKGYVFKSLERRFWEKVETLETGCWKWTDHLTKAGYGQIQSGGRGLPPIYAHRYSYQHKYGFIWPGTEIDHLCRNRWCVNPDHLEAVTHRENALRGQSPKVIIHRAGECGRGHPKTEANIYWRKDRPGHWLCRTCKRERIQANRRSSDDGARSSKAGD